MLILRTLRRVTIWFHAVSVVAIGGCQRDGSFELKDTEGRALRVTCTETKGCTVGPRTGSGALPVAALTLRSDGRVLGVCDRDGPPITCRPLLCESDMDCPTVDGVVRTCGRRCAQSRRVRSHGPTW
jgi:hypothetical protein